MTKKISLYPARFIKSIIIAASLSVLAMTTITPQGFTTLTPITPVNALSSTGEKPQSKVWFYQGYWFTVIPVTGGTYVYRLDGTAWTQLLQISSQTLVKADVKLQGNKTYVLLKDSRVDNTIPQIQTAELITLDFLAGSPPTYTFTTPVTIIPLDNYCETATIDIDNNARMWLASDGGGTSNISGVKNIFVRWSDAPYSSFSSPITIASGVGYDDICAVTAFNDYGGHKIGVMWSDQSSLSSNVTVFGFRYHIDGTDVNTWSLNELAAFGDGGNFADDHINFAVHSNGTIYAAVKTGYDGLVNKPTIGLLVRKPDGTWDPLYKVTDAGNLNYAGTRPVVILNETTNLLTVIYTERVGGNDIVYKESSTITINFPSSSLDIVRTNIAYDDVSCTKDNYTGDVVIIFSEALSRTQFNWHGVIASKSPPFTPDVNNGSGLALHFDGSNDRIDFNTSSSLNITGPLTIEAWINPATYTGRGYILEKYIGAVGGYDLGFQNDFNANYVSFRIGEGASTSQIHSTVIPLNEWTHIAAVYDGSTMKIYKNGVLNVSGNALPSITNSGTNMIIGANNTGTRIQDYFDGLMDEVRIWNVARSISQIRDYMCRKLTGSQPGLVGYWQFDELIVSGTSVDVSVHDYTNFNNGIRVNFNNTIPGGYQWSGAPVGDESSYDYDVSGGYSQTLAHPDGDFIDVVATGGTVDGIQLYYANAPALKPAIPELGLTGSNPTPNYSVTDPLRFWGVKAFGTSLNPPIYDLTYHYDGHPGIMNENDLDIASRSSLAVDTWSGLSLTPNTINKTLTVTGQTGTEFALLSSSNPLPVELSLFNAVKLKSGVKLSWRTETEVNNYGFEVERALSSTTPLQGWEKIGFVNGNGNSNSPKDYSFLDELKSSYGTIQYRLKQIDTDGQFEYSDVISVDLGVPSTFSLSQNYPNPFNPSTKISYTLPIDSKVSLKVYDILGNVVETLVDEQRQAGYYEVNFNANNLSSGIYFYTISADNFNQTKKMTLLK